MKFLLDFCNRRSGLIGHIELVRIYKLISKELFSKEERKEIKVYDCFFDKEDEKKYSGIWNIKHKRVRFLKLEISGDIYIISTVDNVYKKMNPEEYKNFYDEYSVYEKKLVTLNGIVSENIRDKGKGVNLIKHPIIRKILEDLDEKINVLTNEERNKIKAQIIQSSVENIAFEVKGEKIEISINDTQFLIKRNDDSTLFYYENDQLVMHGQNGKKTIYLWLDEGKYKEEQK